MTTLLKKGIVAHGGLVITVEGATGTGKTLIINEIAKILRDHELMYQEMFFLQDDEHKPREVLFVEMHHKEAIRHVKLINRGSK